MERSRTDWLIGLLEDEDEEPFEGLDGAFDDLGGNLNLPG